MTTGFVNPIGLPVTLGVTDGGVGVDSFSVPYGVLCAGTGSTASLQTVAYLGTTTQILTSNGSGALPSFQNAPSYPAGSIIQVVSGSTTSNVEPTGATYTATGVTATITPTSSSNHILIIGSVNLYLTYVATDVSVNVGLQLWRAGSSIVDFGNGEDIALTVLSTDIMPFYGLRSTVHYYDAPATTSATDYEFYINLPSGVSTSGGMNNSGQLSNIYLIEVSV